MKKRLNPWFVFGLSVWTLWAVFILWPREPYSGPWPEFQQETPVWVYFFALLPGAFLVHLIPRQIEDNGKRWWHPGVLNEIAASWVTGIVKLVFGLFVIFGAVLIIELFATFYSSSSEYYGPEWFYDLLARCERLEVELQIDEQCVYSDDCTMSRDDLEAYNERREKHVRYCVNKPSFD